MVKVIEGQLVAKGMRFAIIASRFNEFISSKLKEGAIDALIRHETAKEDITVFWVPGAFEMPVVAKKLAAGGRYDAIICVGRRHQGGLRPILIMWPARFPKGLPVFRWIRAFPSPLAF